MQAQSRTIHHTIHQHTSILIQTCGSQASRKAIIALNESKIRRLRTRGRCDYTYTLKHHKFQQHNVATQATINPYQTSIQHNHNSFENHTCYATKIFNNQYYQLNFSNNLHKATLVLKAHKPSTNPTTSITTQAINNITLLQTIILQMNHSQIQHLAKKMRVKSCANNQNIKAYHMKLILKETSRGMGADNRNATNANAGRMRLRENNQQASFPVACLIIIHKNGA